MQVRTPCVSLQRLSLQRAALQPHTSVPTASVPVTPANASNPAVVKPTVVAAAPAVPVSTQSDQPAANPQTSAQGKASPTPAVQPTTTVQPAAAALAGNAPVSEPKANEAKAADTAAAAETKRPQKRLAAPGKPPGRRSPVRKSKKAKSVNWLTPVIGGGALLVLVLIVAVMSGGGGSSPDNNTGNGSNAQAGIGKNAATNVPENVPPPVDPLAEKYEVVSDAPAAPWAPPRANEALTLDLLPPGGQFFAAMRPAKWMTQAEGKQLLSLLDTDLGPLWKSISDTTGLPIEQIDQVILAAYPADSSTTQTALRVKLIDAQPLSQLKAKWQSPTLTKVKEHSLLVSGPRAFYVQQQPLVDSQSVSEFSVGPVELMREAAELQGVPSAMSGQMEQLRQATDQAADLNLLVNPVFFYTEGRSCWRAVHRAFGRSWSSG